MTLQLFRGPVGSALTRMLLFTKSCPGEQVNVALDGDTIELGMRQLVFWCPNLIAFFGSDEIGLYLVEINLETDLSNTRYWY